jgi:hypothetical protein
MPLFLCELEGCVLILSFRPHHAMPLLGRTLPLLNVQRAHLYVGAVVGILTLDASANNAEVGVLLYLAQLAYKAGAAQAYQPPLSSHTSSV